MTLLDGFSTQDVDGVHVRTKGDGPPLLLLHGYPQTHVMWRRLAPTLAEEHTVVLTDLRGYGDSHHPSEQDAYTKRAMAAEQVAVMKALGFDTFAVAGHDRGARVTHRLCLDHPEAVTRAAVLDIVPTLHTFENADAALGIAYYHWFFLAQAAPWPEQLIAPDPAGWIRHHLAAWSRIDGAFDEDAVAEYVRCFDPDGIHASCEDYRAGAGRDLEHDRADRGRKIAAPLLVLFGRRGFVGRAYDVTQVWRGYADDVRAQAIDCGHFLPEEAPEATLAALREFFG